MKLDYDHIDDIQFDGIDHNDSPDYADCYIHSAFYYGDPMSEEMLEELNNDRDFVYEQLMSYLY